MQLLVFLLSFLVCFTEGLKELGIKHVENADGTHFVHVGHELYHARKHNDLPGQPIERKYFYAEGGRHIRYAYSAHIHRHHLSLDELPLERISCMEEELHMHVEESDAERVKEQLYMGRRLSGGLHYMCRDEDGSLMPIYREVLLVREQKHSHPGKKLLVVETEPLHWGSMFTKIRMDVEVKPHEAPHLNPLNSTVALASGSALEKRISASYRNDLSIVLFKTDLAKDVLSKIFPAKIATGVTLDCPGCSLSIELGIKLGIYLSASLGWSGFSVDYDIRAAVYASAYAKFQPQFEIGGYEFTKEFEPYSWEGSPRVFTVGPVPIVYNANFKLKLEFKATVGKAIIKTHGLEWNPGLFLRGVGCTPRGCSTWAENPSWNKLTWLSPSWEFKEPLTLRATIKPQFGVKFFQTIGVYAGPYPFVELKLAKHDTCTGDFNYRFTANYGVDLGFGIQPIEITIKFPFYTWRKKLADGWDTAITVLGPFPIPAAICTFNNVWWCNGICISPLAKLALPTNTLFRNKRAMITDGNQAENKVPIWMTDPWGECNATCAGGFTTRKVFCASSDSTVYNLNECSVLPRPMTAMQCNTQLCDPCSVAKDCTICSTLSTCDWCFSTNKCQNQNSTCLDSDWRVPGRCRKLQGVAVDLRILSPANGADLSTFSTINISWTGGYNNGVAVNFYLQSVDGKGPLTVPTTGFGFPMNPDLPNKSFTWSPVGLPAGTYSLIVSTGVASDYVDIKLRSYPGNAWTYQIWSECDRDCGGGVQTRNVTCMSSTGPVSSTACNSLQRYASTELCNIEACKASAIGFLSPQPSETVHNTGFLNITIFGAPAGTVIALYYVPPLARVPNSNDPEIFIAYLVDNYSYNWKLPNLEPSNDYLLKAYIVDGGEKAVVGNNMVYFHVTSPQTNYQFYFVGKKGSPQSLDDLQVFLESSTGNATLPLTDVKVGERFEVPLDNIGVINALQLSGSHSIIAAEVSATYFSTTFGISEDELSYACNQYHQCDVCVQSETCGWCSSNGQCLPASDPNGLNPDIGYCPPIGEENAWLPEACYKSSSLKIWQVVMIISFPVTLLFLLIALGILIYQHQERKAILGDAIGDMQSIKGDMDGGKYFAM